MNSIVFKGLAFCTILLLTPIINTALGSNGTPADTYASPYNGQVYRGAQTLPLLAQLTHQKALKALRSGDSQRAEALLMETLELDPNYADPYFTLTKIKAKQFSSDTFYYFSKAIITLLTKFHYQRMIVVNAILFLLFIASLLASIICVAFLIKYLPFAAHRLREALSKRFSTSMPGLSAYMILLIPFVLLPGFITALAMMILLCWGFMWKRERLLAIFMLLPFVALGFFSDQLKPLAPLSDPSSLTSRIAAANESHGDQRLITAIEISPEGSLATEKDLALGLLHLRSEQFLPAATHFLRAISNDPKNMMAYVNLGNVYYLQEDYNKALEGYTKAASLDSLDAICQYNLAQAYIKTLLLGESSRALRRASASGIEKIKQSYASSALKHFPVYPKTFSTGDLWRISRNEGKTYAKGDLGNVLLPLTRFSLRTSAWILIIAFIFAFSIYRVIGRRKLTFQCSNCGELTCTECCNDERGGAYCKSCAEAIEGVFSEKVVEALLRQRRQSVIVKRRKSTRLLTPWLPGIRDIYFGRILRGAVLAFFFSLAMIFLWSKGMIIKDWTSITTQIPIWKTILSASAIALTYAFSIFPKRTFDSRSFRISGARGKSKEQSVEDMAGDAVA
ncbi:MAG: tetratricopeptide repeat protein [Candidatus Latescibacteria bacterium]|nr:tetratricopeptide repeat protein [Candidatus Latescibacterota bacterium]NIO27319.1 tetratricopeptide repeat protein [Candidatus Latescibacterota bacterium]NIO54843.1 tetratricopeptide repeat protein [Candidatus Latescibacterota bacterium]NIT00926.1 tetratricopeptide repeat protein [Candidatus Latescibacterota bacterium]NIT37849.1 tetratricopeptide repeat protein [Candidatus Latescibacterota bacterium]